LEPVDSILVIFQACISYRQNTQKIQWLMRVTAGCALIGLRPGSSVQDSGRGAFYSLSERVSTALRSPPGVSGSGPEARQPGYNMYFNITAQNVPVFQDLWSAGTARLP
jgi:hypothetical protein